MGRWSDSAHERRIREAAHHYRVPRSKFLGRVVADGEAEWLPDDTEAALQWMEYLDSLCKGCGEPKVESMDPDAEGTYEAVPVTCWSCATRDEEQRSVSERIDTPDNRKRGGLDRSAVDGTYITVVKKKL